MASAIWDHGLGGTQDDMSVMNLFVLVIQILQPDLCSWLFIASPGAVPCMVTPLAGDRGTFHEDQRPCGMNGESRKIPRDISSAPPGQFTSSPPSATQHEKPIKALRHLRSSHGLGGTHYDMSVMSLFVLFMQVSDPKNYSTFKSDNRFIVVLPISKASRPVGIVNIL